MQPKLEAGKANRTGMEEQMQPDAGVELVTDADNTPFFTVGIPVWKSRFLAEAIESVLKQRFSDFELVIVDDASPDNIKELVMAFKDSRIRYFRNEKNFGARYLVDNWNVCLKKARGRYFLLLGDDDRLEPDCLEEFSRLIAEYPGPEVYHCRSRLIDEHSQLIGFTESRPPFETIYDIIWHRVKVLRTQFVSDFVYHREALLNAGGYYLLPMGWVSDDITSYRAAKEKGMVHTQQAVVSYRYSRLTMSNSGSVFLKLEAIAGEQQWLEDFLQQVPDHRDERVKHRNLQNYIPRYIRKKRIETLVLWGSWRELMQFSRLLKLGLRSSDLLAAAVLKCRNVITKRLMY